MLRLWGREWPSGGDVYTLTVRAKDLGENETSKTITFTIDRTPPVVRLDTPKDGEYYGTLSPAVNSQQSEVISITGSIVEKNLEIYKLRYGAGDNPTQWTDLQTGNAVPGKPASCSHGMSAETAVLPMVSTRCRFCEG